jgi:hypothetical protein
MLLRSVSQLLCLLLVIASLASAQPEPGKEPPPAAPSTASLRATITLQCSTRLVDSVTDLAETEIWFVANGDGSPCDIVIGPNVRVWGIAVEPPLRLRSLRIEQTTLNYLLLVSHFDKVRDDKDGVGITVPPSERPADNDERAVFVSVRNCLFVGVPRPGAGPLNACGVNIRTPLGSTGFTRIDSVTVEHSRFQGGVPGSSDANAEEVSICVHGRGSSIGFISVAHNYATPRLQFLSLHDWSAGERGVIVHSNRVVKRAALHGIAMLPLCQESVFGLRFADRVSFINLTSNNLFWLDERTGDTTSHNEGFEVQDLYTITSFTFERNQFKQYREEDADGAVLHPAEQPASPPAAVAARPSSPPSTRCRPPTRRRTSARCRFRARPQR